MAVVANKRSIMTLYSGSLDIYCHRVRIVLAEKGVNVEVVDVNPDDKPGDLVDLNPYNFVPTLVDRDLVIYHSQIIMEYLDERFPHPPLMPVYPVARAEHRQIIYRIDRDIYSLLHKMKEVGQEETARKQLEDSLISLSPIFADKPYFLSDEFSLVDCCFAPILWRLPSLGIKLTQQNAKNLLRYQEMVFKRKSFKMSLSDAETELRE